MADTAKKDEKRFGMLIDLSLCVGCNACVVACKMENDVPLTCFNTWIESWDAGEYPNVFRANMPKLCNHCKDAPCVRVCPTAASYVTDEGVVLVDESRCIGCKYCLAACPYQVRWQEPDKGHVDKCTFCYHRTSQGMLPACVSTCITHARIFGDLNDPESDISQRLAEVDAEKLHEELGLDTAVYYVGLSATQDLAQTSVVHKGGNKLVAAAK
ncbi:MAG: 4Fe-4S dicluster domain-containing protein [Raoultibacter sp.]